MYYFTFAYLFVLVLIADKLDEKKKIFLAFLPLFLIVLLRYGVGADYFSYENIYYEVNPDNFYGTLSRMSNIDVLYKALNILALKIGLSYHAFVTIIATTLTAITLKWLKNNSPNFALSVLLHFSMLFIYWNLSALRQGIVVTVLLYVFFNGKKDFSLKTKLIVSAVAFFMHSTAIIVPITYLISELKWTKKTFLILLILSPLSRVIVRPEILNLFSGLPLADRVISYFSYDTISYLSFPTLLRFTFFMTILFHYDKLKINFPKHITMLNFSLVSLLMYFYLPLPMVVGTRVTIFGYYLTTIIFPMIISLYDSKKIYSVLLSGVMAWSFVSFTNEYLKLVDRTGYDKSVHQLNFETVLEKNRNHFNNGYAMHMQVRDANQLWLENSPLKTKVEKEYEVADTRYVEGQEYLSVYFPFNKMYGVIDSQGDVLTLPIYSRRAPIYNNIREIEVGYNSYGAKAYRFIGGRAPILREYAEVQDILMDSINKGEEIASSKLTMEIIDNNILDDMEFLEEYNLNVINRVEKYTYEINPEFSYLRLNTDYSNYYLVLKNDKVLVEKLYNKLHQVSKKGIIVGVTTSSTDYINKAGEIIWYE